MNRLTTHPLGALVFHNAMEHLRRSPESGVTMRQLIDAVLDLHRDDDAETWNAALQCMATDDQLGRDEWAWNDLFAQHTRLHQLAAVLGLKVEICWNPDDVSKSKSRITLAATRKLVQEQLRAEAGDESSDEGGPAA